MPSELREYDITTLHRKPVWNSRAAELVLLALASALLFWGFRMVQASHQDTFAEADAGYADSTMLNLGTLDPANLRALDLLLASGQYMPDPKDRALVVQTLAAYLNSEGDCDGSFPNVGKLNTTCLRVRVGQADSLGGRLYALRVKNARTNLGFTDALYTREQTTPPALPDTSGTGEPSLRGTVRDAQGQPLPGVLVTLRHVVPFYADSLQYLNPDTLQWGPFEQKITWRDSTGTHLYAHTSTVRTGADGRYAFHGLEQGAGYTVLPMAPGYDFGPRQGTDALGAEGLLATLKRWARLHFRASYDFTGQPHRLTLLDRYTFDRLKPVLTARTPSEYRRDVWLILLLFFGPFYLVHALWRWKRFGGDPLLLPVVHLLTGLSLLMMLSIPDPLRDRFLAWDTAWGVAVGVLVLGGVALRNPTTLRYAEIRLPGWRQEGQDTPVNGMSWTWFGPQDGRRWVWLAAATSVLVLLFGTGPEGSGVKVNLSLGLFSFQPSELIKLFMVLFFAGFFATHLHKLRVLTLAKSGSYAVRVTLALVAMLGLYLAQGDLGPALVIGLTFLVLLGIAWSRWWVIGGGLALLVAGFGLGGLLVPRVQDRVSMFLSPWNNPVYGGDHLAQALWTLSTGQVFGQGPGEGYAAWMAEAHTDMVLPSLGEELGLVGLLAVFLLFALLLYRALLISLRTGNVFLSFLGIGLAVVTGLQLFLIAGGAFGLLPLTGVVVPLLSYGKVALILNLAVVGFWLSLSALRPEDKHRKQVEQQLDHAVLWCILAFLLLAGIVAVRLLQVQVLEDDEIVIRPALVAQRDGLRIREDNPRIRIVSRAIPAGTIFDRNGIPLATSDTTLLRTHLQEYLALEVPQDRLERLRFQRAPRRYPFGDLTFYWLGDYNTRLQWGGQLSYFAEEAHLSLLRGFDNCPQGSPRCRDVTIKTRLNRRFHHPVDTTYTVRMFDYSPLRPLLQEGLHSAAMDSFKAQPRDLRLTFDIRLQQLLLEEVEGFVANHPNFASKTFAIAALDASTGEVLASLTYPLPPVENDAPAVAADPNAHDHALFAQRAPGSTLKLATATAAYNKLGMAADTITTFVRADEKIRSDEPVGLVNMEQAIIASSNVYFLRLAQQYRLTNELLEVYRAVGVNMKGRGSPWSQQRTLLRTELAWPKAQPAWGQGSVVAAPLNIAALAGLIANDGLHHPARYVLEQQGQRVSAPRPDSVLKHPEAARQLLRYMKQVPGNTETPLTRLSVAGKTGTAQRGQGRNNDAWYVGVAPPAGYHRLVLCVLIEGGGASSNAAALAYRLFDHLQNENYPKPPGR